ncbi:winged helix-turn-helix domain-containing protein [bacterium]|nr:winged helix-turn-helix domain-containing protein [bacterium]
MKLNPVKKTLIVKGKVIQLTSIEVQILYLLLQEKMNKIKREKIIFEIWTNKKNLINYYNNHLDVALSRLKRKIFEQTSKKIIFSDRNKSICLKI